MFLPRIAVAGEVVGWLVQSLLGRGSLGVKLPEKQPRGGVGGGGGGGAVAEARQAVARVQDWAEAPALQARQPVDQIALADVCLQTPLVVGARAGALAVEARAKALAQELQAVVVVPATVLLGPMALGGRSCMKEPEVTVAS